MNNEIMVNKPENNKQMTKLNTEEALKLGDILCKSGYFPDIRSAAQAVVKILRGQELGIPPLASLEQVFVINGKTALGVSLIASKIKGSGKYDYKVKRLDDTGCELIFYENGKEVGPSPFTIEDAKKAGLLNRDTYQKYPRNLFFARALSNGAKWYCSDIFMGGSIYVPEELEDIEVTEVKIEEDTPVPLPETKKVIEAPITETTETTSKPVEEMITPPQKMTIERQVLASRYLRPDEKSRIEKELAEGMTKHRAMEILNWWLSSKAKGVIGERDRREKAELKNKATAEKIKEAGLSSQRTPKQEEIINLAKQANLTTPRELLNRLAGLTYTGLDGQPVILSPDIKYGDFLYQVEHIDDLYEQTIKLLKEETNPMPEEVEETTE